VKNHLTAITIGLVLLRLQPQQSETRQTGGELRSLHGRPPSPSGVASITLGGRGMVFILLMYSGYIVSAPPSLGS